MSRRLTALCAVLLLVLGSPAAFAYDAYWTAPLIKQFKSNASCAWDSDHNRLLVMGGSSFAAGQTADQLWSFDVDGSSGWTILDPDGPTPDLRESANLLFDAPRHRVLLFGGYRTATGTVLGDLWEKRLDGPHPWQLLNDGTGTGPGPRRGASVVYDAPRDRLVLFGGEGPLGVLNNDVWVLPLTGSPDWSALAPTGVAPAPRRDAPMAFDAPRNRMVIYSGFDGSAYLNDVTVLNLAGSPSWATPTVTGTTFNVNAGYTMAMNFDEVSNTMHVLGGYNGANLRLQVLSMSPSMTWTTVSIAGSNPRPRTQHLVAHDAVAHRDVLFSGYINVSPSGFATDVWSLGASTWTQTPIAGGRTPRPRAGQVLVYDAVVGQVVEAGGIGHGETTPDTDASWLGLSPVSAWAPVATLSGVGRLDFASALDVTRRRVIAVGGSNVVSHTNLSEVWSFNLASLIWSKLTPTGAYPATSGAGAVYDAPRDRVVVFDPALGTVHELSFVSSPTSPVWTQLAPTGSGPSGLTGAMVAHDPVRERLLVLGGNAGSMAPLDHFWALSLNGAPEWTSVPIAGTPPAPRTHGAIAYDAARDRYVLYGGLDGTGTPLTDAWIVPLGGAVEWSPLDVVGPAPIPRTRPGAAYDAANDRLVLFGGDTTNVVPMDPVGDLHFLEFNHLLATPPPASQGGLAFTAGPNPARGDVEVRFARPVVAGTSVEVLDLAGRVLRRETLLAGALAWSWKGAASPGVYFLRVNAPGESATRRVVRLR